MSTIQSFLQAPFAHTNNEPVMFSCKVFKYVKCTKIFQSLKTERNTNNNADDLFRELKITKSPTLWKQSGAYKMYVPV